MPRAVLALAVLIGAMASPAAAESARAEPFVALTATFRTETRNGNKLEHRA